jgi:hypothetical protein
MFIHIPDHFSSSLEFSCKKLPASVTDRPSVLRAMIGVLFGLLLLCLGGFELFSFSFAENTEQSSLLMVEIFALAVILVGVALISFAVFSLIRYKKIVFDGTDFSITYQSAVGVRHHFSEPLSNYIGVRLRVLFAQSGLFHKKRYIIDLYHNDPAKIIPLYISTNGRHIRDIWENYAKIFKMPTVCFGDRGLVRRELEDLGKSLQELGREKKLPFIASGLFPAPNTLNIEEKSNATLISPKKIHWDIFSTLFLCFAVLTLLLLTAGGIYLTIAQRIFPWAYWGASAFLGLVIIYFTGRLFYSYRLEIKNKAILVHTVFLGTSLSTVTLDVAKLSHIELSYDPTIARYSLSFIGNQQIVSLGGRLPVNDLLWLRDFIIRKLIGN